MPLLEHLTELRKRLLWCSVFFVLAMLVGLGVAIPGIQYLIHIEPVKGMDLNAFSPWDAIRIYMQVAIYISFVLSLPFILFQFWLFVRPGLRPEEQRASLLYIPAALLLFVAGAAFGYFIVFPLAFYFTGLLTAKIGLTQLYGLAQYISFLLNILVPISLLFELPVVVMFLTKLRILNPKRLHKFRRYAFILLLIIAALITPPDLISALIVAVPMILLYELSILLSRFVYRKQLAADQEWEKEYGAK